MKKIKKESEQPVAATLKTSRPANRRLRQNKFPLKEVKFVIEHLKVHGKILKGDIPEIPWAHISHFKTNAMLKLPPGPHNRALLMVQEQTNGPWLEVIPEEMTEDWLRTEMLKVDSEMPLSRDGGFHWLKSKTVGISRRALWKFLEKQEHLQMTRNIPNEREKGGAERGELGHVEIDLVHLLNNELFDDEIAALNEYFATQGAEEDLTSRDGYILTVIDQVTRYGVARIQRRKNATETAIGIEILFAKLEKALKSPILKVYSDQGKEFHGAVQVYFKRKKIKHTMVARGAHVEHYNQVLQRSFYRCLKMGRGSVRSCLEQAERMVNATFNKRLGMSPSEAVKKPHDVVQRKYNASRQKGDPNYMKTRVPKIGDKCRYLVNLRKLIRKPKEGIYKTAKGEHFSREVVKIKHIDKKRMRYYAGGAWRDRDQIMLVSGVDGITKFKLEELEKKHNE